MPSIMIDNQTVHVPDGATILEAAQKLGIEIPTLCYLPGRPGQASCFLCVVRIEGSPKLLPSCATRAVDGMVVHSENDEVRHARRTAIELLLSDHLGDCVAPCQGVCPAHMNIPEMMRLTAAGRFRDALVVVKQHIALPAVLGRICPELCEKGCRREARDGALSVCLTKRFVADHDLATGDPYLPALAPSTGRKVAIIGSGPAGLAAAYYLQPMGHSCTILDDHELPGGMLRYGVSRDDLPEDVLDAEIDLIRRLGAQIRCGVRVGRDASLTELREDYDAVLVAGGDLRERKAEWPDLAFGPQGAKVDKLTMMTALPGVFAAGGSLIPAKHAVRAVADGRAAADAIGAYLTGGESHREGKEFSVHIGKLDCQGVEPFMRLASMAGRHEPSGGTATGFDADEVRREAERCLLCACEKAGTCRLRRIAGEYGAQPLRFGGERREYSVDDSHPDIVFEPGKCIACGICVRLAAEGREELGLTFIGRGFGVRTAAPFNSAMVEGLREVALACADACPTGALVRKPQ